MHHFTLLYFGALHLLFKRSVTTIYDQDCSSFALDWNQGELQCASWARAGDQWRLQGYPEYVVIWHIMTRYKRACIRSWGGRHYNRTACPRRSSKRVQASQDFVSWYRRSCPPFGTPRAALSRNVDVCGYIKTKALHTASKLSDHGME